MKSVNRKQNIDDLGVRGIISAVGESVGADKIMSDMFSAASFLRAKKSVEYSEQTELTEIDDVQTDIVADSAISARHWSLSSFWGNASSK